MLSEIRLDGSPAGHILKLLQQRGPVSIKEIEAALGVTTTAVRQQLTTLMTAEMVTAETVREKRGRPFAVYRLAEKGQALFARGYEELALALLEEILRLPESETAHLLLHRVSTRLGQQYAERMHGAAVAERLQELATLLAAHGIINKVDEKADAFVLTEYGCPYYGVAREHREVCGMETQAIELALGSPVTLYQSQLDGHNSCQFQVKK
ncbi:MAG: helix-turn-helix transcriptional regulator [Candidatus Tectimicrobiota bacterium]